MLLFLGVINYNNFIFVFILNKNNNNVEASGDFSYNIFMH